MSINDLSLIQPPPATPKPEPTPPIVLGDPAAHAPRYSWTQPICELCFILENGTFEEVDGKKMLTSVRQPVLLKTPVAEICCYCGNVTIIGCYTRVDPLSVGYPSLLKD